MNKISVVLSGQYCVRTIINNEKFKVIMTTYKNQTSSDFESSL